MSYNLYNRSVFTMKFSISLNVKQLLYLVFPIHRDNYGFVTYYNTDDAFAAIEKGRKLRQPDELPFDICFGGRRQFCQSNYMDLGLCAVLPPLHHKNFFPALNIALPLAEKSTKVC